nr:hypothetical protein [Rhodobacter capsulatus]
MFWIVIWPSSESISRAKAGCGETMAFLSAMANSYGAKWFDMDWKPQFDGGP